MHVLHVVSRSQQRGAERSALDLARALDELGHENHVVALARAFDGGEIDDLQPLTSRTRIGAASLAAEARALRRELTVRPVDVVLAHGGHAVEVAALGRRRDGPLVVWQRILGFHDSIRRAPRRWWWQFVVGRIDAAVALTDELEAEVRALGFDGPVWVIENFRDPSRFVGLDHALESERLRSQLGIPPTESLIGFVGHLVQQKRPDRALDVLAEVHRLGAETAHLVIVGDGPLRMKLERAIRARRLDQFVHLLGARDDVERILAALDVFILTSDDEGIPGVLIEAAMAGCCVVAPDLGGIANVVLNDKTGILSAHADALEIAKHVYGVLRDERRRVRMRTEARNCAEQFSSHAAARLYVERFQTLVRAHRV